jgi:endoglucanase
VSLRPSRHHRRPAALAAAAAVGVTVAAGVWFATGTASAGTLAGSLYREPNTQVSRWVAANPNDSRTPVISTNIASQPEAHWLSNFNTGTVQSEVASYVSGANSAGQIPVLSVYGITNRDCGGASAGGAPDLTQYQTWISNLAKGLGSQTVVIVLETDSIALQTCLSASDVTARDQALSTATQTLKAANANAKVYLDGGHSAWNSASDQASRLKAAGVQFADGFFTNVSNFNSTANETAYGASIISNLAGLGVPGKHQIIDTSRNGGASGDWCADDNTDRRIGQYPTTATGNANIDAYLWVKPPGEADGCSFTAGSFQPALAFSLANGVAPPPTTSASPIRPSSAAPVTSAPMSSAPVSSAPASSAPASSPPASSPAFSTPPLTPPASSARPTGSCTATYQTINSWQGGFQGQVTVTAGSAAINGWTVKWTLPSGQSITQSWNVVMTLGGSNVTATNLSWNAMLAPGASTTFGFLGSGSPGASGITCTSP